MTQSLGVQSIMMGKSWWWELKMAGHAASTVRSGGWEWMSAGDRLAFSFLYGWAARVGLSIPIDLNLPVPSTCVERFVTEMVLDHVKLTSNINPYRRQNQLVFTRNV